MSLLRILTGLTMIVKMLVRRRIVLILMVVIPVVFLSIVEFTSSERILPFRLASLDKESFVEISEKGISFIFFAVASAGFLVSFLALNLIQKNSASNRRLVLCGFHPIELLLSNLISLLLMTFGIGIYVGLLTLALYPIEHLITFITGLVMIGFVYGCYGLVAGSLTKGELEGILLIVLLVNIDAGWLQNPMFYAEAQNQAIIRYLPAYFPSQTSIIAAFTDYSVMKTCLYSVLYGLIFLLLSMIIFFKRMKIKK